MKEKVIAAVVALAIAFAGFFVLTAPAKAQGVPVSATCVAQSQYAIGQWVSGVSMDHACAEAMNQCRIRTPEYGTCYIVRRWFNYY